MPAKTRRMRTKLEKAAIQESILPTKTINDFPPEVLEMILKKLGSDRKAMLRYRLVHSEWANLINGILANRALKGSPIACPKVFIEIDSIWECNPNPTIRVPQAIIDHTGNPFPSRSLCLSQHRRDRRNVKRGFSDVSLVTFTTTFGSHLTTFVADRVCVSFSVLISVLRQFPNLRKLTLSSALVGYNSKDDPQSFPALPHLKTLELQGVRFLDVRAKRVEERKEDPFLQSLINSYNLASLKLCQTSIPLQMQLPSVENGTSQTLQQLVIFNPTADFLRLSCIRPVKRLSIVGLDTSDCDVSIEVIMSFIDKFSNTLESIDLDFPWDDLCESSSKQTRGILETAGVTFPKLTKFTIAYPTSKLKAAFIKKNFLLKFPILKELSLFHFEQASDKYPEKARKYYKKIIKKFTDRENYWQVSPTLNRISVWFSGERSDFGRASQMQCKNAILHTQNYHVHSVFRGESGQ